MARLDDVPIAGYLKDAFPDDWVSLALGGGEDYELLFNAPQQIIDATASGLDVPVSVIGEIAAGPPTVILLDREGGEMAVERGGWDHFRAT